MELRASTFVLRPWHLSDAESLQRHANNPKVAGCLLDRFPSPYTMKDAVDWVTFNQNQNPVVNFAIAVDGHVVGGIGFDFRTDIYRKTPLVGYWLSEEYWGRGIMPEALKLVTNYAFEQLDVICIQANPLSKNSKSVRVLEKAGYSQQGIIKQSIIKDGEIMDEYIFAIQKLMLL
jgi:ribosomal-protein-alanine N-acetyltransferase